MTEVRKVDREDRSLALVSAEILLFSVSLLASESQSSGK